MRTLEIFPDYRGPGHADATPAAPIAMTHQRNLSKFEVFPSVDKGNNEQHCGSNDGALTKQCLPHPAPFVTSHLEFWACATSTA